MAERRAAYAPEYWRQMVELVRIGRPGARNHPPDMSPTPVYKQGFLPSAGVRLRAEGDSHDLSTESG